MSEKNRDEVQGGSSPKESLLEQLQKNGLTPEVREWARREFTEEEIVAALRELREKGGKELGEFLQELEQLVVRS